MNAETQSISIGTELHSFIQDIDSLATTLPLTMAVIQEAHKAARQEFKEFEENYCLHKKEGDSEYLVVEADHIARFNRHARRVNRAEIAYSKVPRSFVVSLVSQFDSFLGRLIRALFYLRPEKLSSSERSISFAQLIEFNSVENAKEYVIEKEIETVLRKSHAEQFDWLEGRFDLSLRKDLPIWTAFIELTERRNLFVHCDGKVSTQYIRVCGEHGISLDDDIEVGKQIAVTPDYFERAYACMFEIGVKLAQVLWRKHQPEVLEKADLNLINISYDLLYEERYELAINLLDFATKTLKKHSTDQIKRIFIVNRAQAYKWSGDDKMALEVLSSADWSAASDEFKLAEAVLTDNFPEAIKLMTRIGQSGDLKKSDYRDWPLFKMLRKKKEFIATFEAIFDEPFNKIDTDDKALLTDGRQEPTEAQPQIAQAAD